MFACNRYATRSTLFLLNNWGQEEGATTACFYYLNEMVHDIKNLWPKSDVEAVIG